MSPAFRPPRGAAAPPPIPLGPDRAAAVAERHLDVIWRMARRLGVADADIEDVAQEVLVIVVRRVEQIELGKERAFVASATVRVAANFRRARLRRREEPAAAPQLEGACPPEASWGDAERALERSRSLCRLERALEAMTGAQREAFILFDLEQLTAREISEQLGVPEAAVVSRVRRAREVLRHFSARGEPRAPAGGMRYAQRDPGRQREAAPAAAPASDEETVS